MVDLVLFMRRDGWCMVVSVAVGLARMRAGHATLFVTHGVCWGHDVRTVWREGRGAGEAGATG